MRAGEARKLTEEALRGHSGVVAERLEILLCGVESEAKNGVFSLDADLAFKDLSEAQSKALESRLRELGYGVKKGSDQREGSWAIVSWA